LILISSGFSEDSQIRTVNVFESADVVAWRRRVNCELYFVKYTNIKPLADKAAASGRTAEALLYYDIARSIRDIITPSLTTFRHVMLIGVSAGGGVMACVSSILPSCNVSVILQAPDYVGDAFPSLVLSFLLWDKNDGKIPPGDPADPKSRIAVLSTVLAAKSRNYIRYETSSGHNFDAPKVLAALDSYFVEWFPELMQ